MSYSICQLKVRNFKCFDSKKFYTFAFKKDRNPAILSGPNGFGKTTFFDAIELIFTNQITRLQTSIEDGRLNLGKNILLNESDKYGNLVLTLIDEKDNYLTVIAVIDFHLQKLNINQSIKYSVFEGIFNSDEEIELFINNQKQWESSLKQLDKIRYHKNHFNVYYYVSQAESVHFLKKNINERKDSMNEPLKDSLDGLLNTTMIDKYIERITDKLIGKHATKKDVIINDAINTSNQIINSKVGILNSKLQDFNLSSKKVEYSQLLEYPINVTPMAWDVKTLDLKNLSLHSAINEIQALHSFATNSKDYNVYLQNQKITMLIQNDGILNDL